jgi:hypothetical protein
MAQITVEEGKTSKYWLKHWIAKTDKLSLKEKRYYLNNFQKLTPEEFKEIFEIARNKEREREEHFFHTDFGRKIKKVSIWILILSLIYWYFHPHGVFVLADPLSVYRYRVVLSDLKREMPEEYKLVRDYVEQISVAYIMSKNHAGVAHPMENGKNKVVMLENTFVQGPGYAHSVLVHEACHGLQFAKGLPFRTSFCDHQSREHACNMWGIKVLKKFNGKPEMIKWYEGIAQGDTVYGNSCERDGTLEKMPEL